MSIIAAVVKGALALDQQVQALVHKVAHGRASSYFQQSVTTEEQAIEAAEQGALRVERERAASAALMITRHLQALKRLHQDADNRLDLVDGRKQQVLGKAAQQRQAAVAWQGTAIRADLAAEAARKAAEQLG